MAISTVPVAGDLAAFVLTMYAIKKAKEVGVPNHKLAPVLKLAAMDAVVGFIPVAGTIFDVMIRPSQKALEVVHEHIREEYQIQTDHHIVHPFLHESLQEKQKNSAFWRNPIVAWIWIHIPDLLGVLVVLLFIFSIVTGIYFILGWIKA